MQIGSRGINKEKLRNRVELQKGRQVITLTLAITMRVTLVGDFQNPFSPSIYIVSFKTLL